MNLSHLFQFKVLKLAAFLTPPVLLTLLAPKIAPSSTSAPQAEEQFERSFTVNPKGSSLEVDNPKGKILVTGSDNSQVTVSVHKYFMGRETDRARWIEETTVNFSNQPARVAVQVHYPAVSCSRDCDQGNDFVGYVDLTIKVPRNIDVKLQGTKPEISVASIEGDIQIASEKSPIQVLSTTGAIHIETGKDLVKLNDVNIRGTLDLKIATGKAEIAANNLDKEVNLETRKGSIVVRLPQNAGVNLDYVGGSRSYFHSDFSIEGNSNSQNQVQGVINQGGTNMHIRSERGSIFLLKMNH